MPIADQHFWWIDNLISTCTSPERQRMLTEPHEKPDRVYNLSLLHAFIANVFQLISVSLLFRYADYVSSIGGDEWHLGWIVGISAVGAILFRIIQGAAIDRFGAEWIWYLCMVGQIAGLTWHLQIDSVSSVSVYLARTLYASSLAGTFGAWLSFVSLQAPAGRVAEVIGVVGASGFVGMATGPVIGDYIFADTSTFDRNVELMLYVSAGSVVMSLLFAICACRSSARSKSNQPQKTPRKNPIRIVREANPGFVLVLGALMGMTIGFPGTYLRPFAASMSIEQIKLFFIVYNFTAFISRLFFRKAPQQLGLKKTIILGYLLMAGSMLLYLVVDSESDLVWPAFAGGLAHSFLFPSVITLCTEYFSSADRGVATNLILGMYDMGTLIGMPLAGAVLTQSRLLGLAPYATTFTCIALLISATMVTFVLLGRIHQKASTQNS